MEQLHSEIIKYETEIKLSDVLKIQEGGIILINQLRIINYPLYLKIQDYKKFIFNIFICEKKSKNYIPNRKKIIEIDPPIIVTEKNIKDIVIKIEAFNITYIERKLIIKGLSLEYLNVTQ